MFLQLQVSHLQLVSANAFVAGALALCAAKVEILHIEFSSTVEAAVPAGTEFNFQL
jgi:hypothetical protein